MDRRLTRLLASLLLLAAFVLLTAKVIAPKEAAAPKDGYIEVKQTEYAKLKQEAKRWKQELDESEKEKTKLTPNKDKAVQTLHLNITEGMSSKEVTKQLEKAKIIKDANRFNDYLADKDLQQSIQIGDYTLTSDMDFKKIAEIMTGK